MLSIGMNKVMQFHCLRHLKCNFFDRIEQRNAEHVSHQFKGVFGQKKKLNYSLRNTYESLSKNV